VTKYTPRESTHSQRRQQALEELERLQASSSIQTTIDEDLRLISEDRQRRNPDPDTHDNTREAEDSQSLWILNLYEHTHTH
jgi:hypothetical protein